MPDSSTNKTYHPDLIKALEHLVEQVLTYQSDVWNSQEEKVTREEAEKAAALLIYHHLFDEHGIAHIDGADVGFAVESLDISEKEIQQAEYMRLMHEAVIEGSE